MSGRPALRASDDDREVVAALLRRSHLEGRLSVEELEERLERAHRAVTLADLAALRADLPAPPPAARPRARRARKPPRMPGRLAFVERTSFDVPPARAHERAMDLVVPAMLRYGYSLDERSADRLVFSIRRRPGWTIAVAVVGFPVGLIALAHTVDERVAVELEPGRDGGTSLTAHGIAPLAVRRAFAALDG